MKNQETKQIEKSVDSKKEINLVSAKISLKNSKIELADKEKSGSSRKDIYLGMEGLNSDERKTKRTHLRNKLKRFVSNILGKDRKDEERIEAIEDFLSFYKLNWRITDFKIENFSQSKNNADLKDYRNLLEFVKSTLEG